MKKIECFELINSFDEWALKNWGWVNIGFTRFEPAKALFRLWPEQYIKDLAEYCQAEDIEVFFAYDSNDERYTWIRANLTECSV